MAGRDPGRRPRAARGGDDRARCRGGSGSRPRAPLVEFRWRATLRRAALRGGDRPAGRGEARAGPAARPLGRRRSGAGRARCGPGVAKADGRRGPRHDSGGHRSTSRESRSGGRRGPLAELVGRLAAIAARRRASSASPAVWRRRRAPPVPAPGVTWLHAMADGGLGGCLADDMGLGKTLQVIALHLHRAAADRGPTLVVCPTSLLGNWEREVRRFAPGTPVRRHHGRPSLDGLGPAEIVADQLRRRPQGRRGLAEAGFSLVVADEAQQRRTRRRRRRAALRTSRPRPPGPHRDPGREPAERAVVDPRLDHPWPARTARTVRAYRGHPVERDRDPLRHRAARPDDPPVRAPPEARPTRGSPRPAARTVTDVPVPLTQEQATLYEAEVREALAGRSRARTASPGRGWCCGS